MRNARSFTMIGTVFAAAMSATAMTPLAAQAADAVLSGTIKSADGAALGGVTVSARADGANIVTSVFTDEAGNYYFPPMAEGKYKVWAQAITFDTGRGDVALGGAKRQDFALKPLKDFVRQLPGDMVLAALPDATPQDATMKTIVQNSCTGCHTPSYILQHRFDEAGWNAIINLMKNANVYGIYQGPDHKASPVLDHNQKQLAAYLARARGPGESSMKFNLRPRPTRRGRPCGVHRLRGAARSGCRHALQGADQSNGTDWSLGTPSYVYPGFGVHDAWIDADGTSVYFTCNVPNNVLTLGKFDLKTGAFKALKVAQASNGLAAPAYCSITRDPNGIIWFNVKPGKGGLGKIDTKTDKIEVFIPPDGMAPTGGATTVDYDGRGMIWVSSPTGALRFDPAAEKFTEYKSPTQKSATGGIGLTYGVAADRGNCAATATGPRWRSTPWASATASTAPPRRSSCRPSRRRATACRPRTSRSTTASARRTSPTRPRSRKVRAAWAPTRTTTCSMSAIHGPARSPRSTRRRRQETSTIPLPALRKPYQIAVDSRHNAWLNIWMTDQVLRYDPKANSFTAFDIPTRGSEARYVSLFEKDGQTKVVLPSYRTRKVSVMAFRSEADIAATKAQAAN